MLTQKRAQDVVVWSRLVECKVKYLPGDNRMTVALLIATTITAGAILVDQPDDAPVMEAGAAPAQSNPPLHDLIVQMAAHEQSYLPYQMKVMETFRFSEDVTPQYRERNARADGRKHQKLMEYAQLARGTWRTKESHLVDDQAVPTGPYEEFRNGERRIQVSPTSRIGTDGRKIVHVEITQKERNVRPFASADPVYGVFCLSATAPVELFSETFLKSEDQIELSWDNGDAKLSFEHGLASPKSRFVLWLSRAHNWHPVRLQRYRSPSDKAFFSEWNATRLVRQGESWRVAEGTVHYRDYREKDLTNAKVVYSLDFKVLEAKYGDAVSNRQFEYQIPEGARVRVDGKPVTEPAPITSTREVSVEVTDLAGKPVPGASVRLRTPQAIAELDHVVTDEQGTARSSKAPQDDVLLNIQGDNYRPAIMILGSVSKWGVILAPQTTGVVVDEQGNPVPAAWITNRPIQFRADGTISVPDQGLSSKQQDWSNDDGSYALQTDLTLRDRSMSVPFFAVHPDCDRMAVRFVPARELDRPQKLILQSVCRVRGHCLLEGMTDAVGVRPVVQTGAGNTIAQATTRQELTPAGLRLDFELRLPPGEYELAARPMSDHPGFTIPIVVAPQQHELDLGTTTVAVSGLWALRGKPAPKLDLRWRPGEELKSEQLRGRVTVLDFWGFWCRPCVADMPLLMEIADQFRDKPVSWIAIHTADVKDFDELDRHIQRCRERFWNNRAFSLKTAIDVPVPDEDHTGKTSQSFHVFGWPTLVIIDQNGNVIGPVHKSNLAATISRLLDSGIAK
jgi:thiol-disulfide isomerase/thioredoxin